MGEKESIKGREREHKRGERGESDMEEQRGRERGTGWKEKKGGESGKR